MVTAYKRRPSNRSVHRRLCEYTSFVKFHASRPIEVASYYELGFRVADVHELNARAKQMLISERFPEITLRAIEEAIARVPTSDDKKLFFVIDARELSGHYLIYGSEHICAVAAHLPHRDVLFDARQLLKYFGTSTLFRVALPRELIPADQLRELAEHLVQYFWNSRNWEQPPRLDWSFVLRKAVHGKHIIDHCHPEKIPDPMMQYIPYRYRDNFPCFI